MTAVKEQFMPRKPVRLLMNDRYDAYVSRGIIEEYNETDAQLKEDYPDKPVSFSLESIISKMHQIDVTTEVHVCRDPDDDKFIGCAIDSKSKYIVSGDKDLLSAYSCRSKGSRRGVQGTSCIHV